jgi:glycosyltransferase involved in cell wall biosynthesis
MAILTVMMSVFNGIQYIRKSVDSVLNQSYSEYEFIIINDGSNDDTEKYLNTLCDKRVRVINQENRGLGAALNNGLSLVKTEYIARMDADDISLPNRLKKQMRYITDRPSIVMLGCGIAFTIDGIHYGCAPPLPISHDNIVYVLKNGGHAISHPTIVCRTDAIQKVGGYRINQVGQDWDLFLRMSEVGEVGNIPEIQYLYRLHKNSSSWKSSVASIRGKDYALYCYSKRQMGEQEPNIRLFLKNWERRNVYRKFISNCKIISDRLYRSAILDFLNNKRFKGILLMVMSTISYPPKFIMRIYKIMNN